MFYRSEIDQKWWGHCGLWRANKVGPVLIERWNINSNMFRSIIDEVDRSKCCQYGDEAAAFERASPLLSSRFLHGWTFFAHYASESDGLTQWAQQKAAMKGSWMKPGAWPRPSCFYSAEPRKGLLWAQQVTWVLLWLSTSDWNIWSFPFLQGLQRLSSLEFQYITSELQR